jgi:hypothetical protein
MPAAEAVTAFLEHFRWMADPSVDPIRTKIRQFFVDYLDSKGSSGATIDEGLSAFNEAVARDPQSWPVPDDRLQALWRDTTRVLNKLPPLARPAQLVWLGFEAGHDDEIIDAALVHEFPLFTPFDIEQAYRETADYMRREATGSAIAAAIFQVWTDIEKAKGRPEGELVFGNCIAELGIVEERDDGSEYVNFNKLKHIADPELRRATLGAAWRAHEEAGERTP